MVIEMDHVPTVAYLGPQYSYSYLAAVAHFHETGEFVPFATISSIFEAIASRDCEYGVVPIENSTDGRIVDTLNVLSQSPALFCGEVNLSIHHNLLAQPGVGAIQAIHSKPQALSQCRDWIQEHYPEVQLVPTTSTTAAARNASQDPQVAAIASLAAAEHYALNVIAASIEDTRDNITRFAVLGNRKIAATGDDKTTLLMGLDHAPGALADAMAVFKSEKINLTWIESFPKLGHPNEYVFFLEFLGHIDTDNVRQTVELLRACVQDVHILGSYPRSPVDG